MKLENIVHLDIYWFVTYGGDNTDFPRNWETELLEAFKLKHNAKRPRWNKKD